MRDVVTEKVDLRKAVEQLSDEPLDEIKVEGIETDDRADGMEESKGMIELEDVQGEGR
jgi:hypothetical protein